MKFSNKTFFLWRFSYVPFFSISLKYYVKSELRKSTHEILSSRPTVLLLLCVPTHSSSLCLQMLPSSGFPLE
jgi:hypothetical protein